MQRILTIFFTFFSIAAWADSNLKKSVTGKWKMVERYDFQKKKVLPGNSSIIYGYAPDGEFGMYVGRKEDKPAWKGTWRLDGKKFSTTFRKVTRVYEVQYCNNKKLVLIFTSPKDGSKYRITYQRYKDFKKLDKIIGSWVMVRYRDKKHNINVRNSNDRQTMTLIQNGQFTIVYNKKKVREGIWKKEDKILHFYGKDKKLIFSMGIDKVGKENLRLTGPEEGTVSRYKRNVRYSMVRPKDLSNTKFYRIPHSSFTLMKKRSEFELGEIKQAVEDSKKYSFKVKKSLTISGKNYDVEQEYMLGKIKQFGMDVPMQVLGGKRFLGYIGKLNETALQDMRSYGMNTNNLPSNATLILIIARAVADGKIDFCYGVQHPGNNQIEIKEKPKQSLPKALNGDVKKSAVIGKWKIAEVYDIEKEKIRKNLPVSFAYKTDGVFEIYLSYKKNAMGTGKWHMEKAVIVIEINKKIRTYKIISTDTNRMETLFTDPKTNMNFRVTFIRAEG